MSILSLLKNRWKWRRSLVACFMVIVAWHAMAGPRGMMMAYWDHGRGHYELKPSGPLFRWTEETRRLLQERFGVTCLGSRCCASVRGFGLLALVYDTGYNSISLRLLTDRYGRDVFADCARDAAENWRASHVDE